MAETANYHLFLSDDNQMKFLEWREKISGTQASNMVKIDAAINRKANKSVTISATLFANKWSGAQAPYTQQLSISGMTADKNGSIALAQNATVAERTAARLAVLSVTGQSNGKLTITADRNIPSIDIPVTVIIVD